MRIIFIKDFYLCLLDKKITPLGVLIKLGGGGWIWTNDLLVMGQTSYQAALPRDINSILAEYCIKVKQNGNFLAAFTSASSFNRVMIY